LQSVPAEPSHRGFDDLAVFFSAQGEGEPNALRRHGVVGQGRQIRQSENTDHPQTQKELGRPGIPLLRLEPEIDLRAPSAGEQLDQPVEPPSRPGPDDGQTLTRERHTQTPEVPPERPHPWHHVPANDPHLLGRDAAIEESTDPLSDPPHLGLGVRRLGKLHHRQRLYATVDLAIEVRQPLFQTTEVGGAEIVAVGPGRIGRPVEENRAAEHPDHGEQEIRRNPGHIGKAVDQEAPGGDEIRSRFSEGVLGHLQHACGTEGTELAGLRQSL
jgi:hypothetical protein